MADDNNNDSYADEQYKTLSYSQDQFDKNVLFIASGALGVSFAFVEKLVPDLANAINKDCLTKAWYWFAAVIFMSLLSHFVSILSLRWSISHHEDDDFDKKKDYWNWSIRGLNVFMIIGLLVGTLFLINFINDNINQPKKPTVTMSDDKNKQQQGSQRPNEQTTPKPTSKESWIGERKGDQDSIQKGSEIPPKKPNPKTDK